MKKYLLLLLLSLFLVTCKDDESIQEKIEGVWEDQDASGQKIIGRCLVAETHTVEFTQSGVATRHFTRTHVSGTCDGVDEENTYTDCTYYVDHYNNCIKFSDSVYYYRIASLTSKRLILKAYHDAQVRTEVEGAEHIVLTKQ